MKKNVGVFLLSLTIVVVLLSGCGQTKDMAPGPMDEKQSESTTV